MARRISPISSFVASPRGNPPPLLPVKTYPSARLNPPKRGKLRVFSPAKFRFPHQRKSTRRLILILRRLAKVARGVTDPLFPDVRRRLMGAGDLQAERPGACPRPPRPGGAGRLYKVKFPYSPATHDWGRYCAPPGVAKFGRRTSLRFARSLPIPPWGGRGWPKVPRQRVAFKMRDGAHSRNLN